MNPDEILERIIGHFRKGCILRRAGKLDEAQAAFAEVPTEIQQWSQSNTLQTSEEKKARLRELFQREQARVEDAYLVCDLVSDRLQQELVDGLGDRLVADVSQRLLSRMNNLPEPAGVPVPPAPATAAVPPGRAPIAYPPDEKLAARLAKPQREKRERVSFDDISGMIDMLLDEEYQKRG